MFIISRQKDETIIIGDDIEVTVVDIRGDRVRLGFKFPEGVNVDRKEVYDAAPRKRRAETRIKPPEIPQRPSDLQ